MSKRSVPAVFCHRPFFSDLPGWGTVLPCSLAPSSSSLSSLAGGVHCLGLCFTFYSCRRPECDGCGRSVGLFSVALTVGSCLACCSHKVVGGGVAQGLGGWLC